MKCLYFAIIYKVFVTVESRTSGVMFRAGEGERERETRVCSLSHEDSWLVRACVFVPLRVAAAVPLLVPTARSS